MNFKIECSILLIIITLIVQNTRAQQLYINEFMALNDIVATVKVSVGKGASDLLAW